MPPPIVIDRYGQTMLKKKSQEENFFVVGLSTRKGFFGGKR